MKETGRVGMRQQQENFILLGQPIEQHMDFLQVGHFPNSKASFAGRHCVTCAIYKRERQPSPSLNINRTKPCLRRNLSRMYVLVRE